MSKRLYWRQFLPKKGLCIDCRLSRSLLQLLRTVFDPAGIYEAWSERLESVKRIYLENKLEHLFPPDFLFAPRWGMQWFFCSSALFYMVYWGLAGAIPVDCVAMRDQIQQRKQPLGWHGHKSTAEGGIIIVFEQQNTGRVSVGSNTSFHQEQQKEASLQSLLFHSQSSTW